MRKAFISLLVIASFSPVFADTVTIDGITWTYTISNGEASIDRIPISTTGAIAIPSMLDGYPVTSIGPFAFGDCSGLTSVTIPDSVTSIGVFAFNGCSGLTLMTIPDSVTNIEDAAFFGCSENLFDTNSIQGIVLVDGWAVGHTDELFGTLDLTGIRGVASYAFGGCTRLISITLPDCLTNVSSGAFSGCDSLQSIVISDDNPSYFSSGGIMYSKDGHQLKACPGGLTSITIPDSVTSIGDSAFSGCSGLTSITIPDSVTSIGGSAFGDCSGLTSITIPDSVTSIGNSAFSGCSGLTSITIPDSVTSIGNYAFSGCSGLTSITIPDSVTSIGNYVFCDCTGLTNIVIGTSVTSIGWSAFEGCSGLTSVTIPDSVTNIEGAAFFGCSGLSSIIIGAGVTSIGAFAFTGCSGLISIVVDDNNPVYDSRNSCNAIIQTPIGVLIVGSNDSTIPDGVTSIGNSAFSGCSGLTSITIPDSVTSIANYAFSGCSGLTDVTADPKWGQRFFSATNLSFTIPDGVTSIGNYAFYDCSGLTSITIPDSVTSIGNYAFYGCSGLTSITIPDSVTSIGNYAFYWAWGILSFSVNENNPVYSSENGLLLSKNGETLIRGVSGNVTIPDSVTNIENGAFRDCYPESVTADPRWASLFSSATVFTIPDGVTNIGDYSFSACRSLTSITIPNSVTNIGDYAFSGCSRLTSITIPDSVTSIGTNSFINCSSLQKLYLPNSYAGIIPSVAYRCDIVRYDELVFLSVFSPVGRPVPSGNEIVCASNEVLACSVASQVTVSESIRWMCEGWTGTGSVPASGSGNSAEFTIREDSSITWNWQEQIWVEIVVTNDASGGGRAYSEWLARTGETTGIEIVRPDGPFVWNLYGDTNGVVVDFEESRLTFPADNPRSMALDIHVLTINEAVEGEGDPLDWNEGSGWSVVEDASATDGDGYSIRSGTISANQTTTVEATVVGAGTLSFDWRVSTMLRRHYARFYVDGVRQKQITGETMWHTETISLDDGPHFLRWTYEKSAAGTSGDDAAFLDNVRWSPLTLNAALDATNLVWTTDGDSSWIPQIAETADGVDAAKSGTVSGEETSSLIASFEGPCMLAWKWKARIDGIAGVDVWLDGVWLQDLYLDETMEWTGATLAVEGGGPHSIEFLFWNGGTEATISDCTYIDSVSWTPAGGGKDGTVTTPESVPYAWLDEYRLGDGSENGYEAAALATAANGVNKVWECYVAGLSPTNAAARLEARIELDAAGKPVVTWTPDLNEGGTKHERVYRVLGAKSLGDAEPWDDVTGLADPDAVGYRFFKAKVEMPE